MLTQFGPGYDFSRLFSATDANPAAPIWENQVSVLTYNQRSASADETDVYVTLHDQALTTSTRRLFLRRFRSGSSTPEWTYEVPSITNTHDLFDVAVSQDGERIVVVTVNSSSTNTDVYVFGPDSPTPTMSTSVPIFGFLRAFDLSADGSRLIIGSDLFAKVIDTDSGAEVDSVTLSMSPLTLAISGDGESIAIGGQNALVVYAMNDSGRYRQLFANVLEGTWFCRAADISAGGETLACAFVGYGSSRGVRTYAYDMQRSILEETGVETMSYSKVFTGALSNGIADLEVSTTGDVFAVGTWGDANGDVPEVLVFQSDKNAPLYTHDLPGSVQALDLSGDGKRLAVASKSVHNNTAGSGGRLDLYDLEVGDLRVHGVPTTGSSVRVELEGQPGRPAQLLVSRSLSKFPNFHRGVGSMALDRKSAWIIPMGTFDQNGVASLDYALPENAVGLTLYFQGAQQAPAKLSETWIKVTVLP